MLSKKIFKDKEYTGEKGEGQDIMLAISKREYISMIGVAKAPRRPNKHSQNDNKQEYAKKTKLLLNQTKQVHQQKARGKKQNHEDK